MTRKDYILIAEALQISLKDWETAAPTSLMRNSPKTILINTFQNIASALANDNPRFDGNHFLAVIHGEKSLTSRPRRQS